MYVLAEKIGRVKVTKTSEAPVSKQDSVIHSTFSIGRTYPQPPARVFFTHANEAMKRRWLAEGEGWTVNKFTLDFRVGGSEISRFRVRSANCLRGAACLPRARKVYASGARAASDEAGGNACLRNRIR